MHKLCVAERGGIMSKNTAKVLYIILALAVSWYVGSILNQISIVDTGVLIMLVFVFFSPFRS